jgi:uncharacterized protein (TIGR02246 family)
MAKPTPTDYTAIRMVAERYVDAVNRFDGEAWGQCWAPDGVWILGGDRSQSGRDSMVAMWTGIMKSIPHVYMHVYSGVVDDVTGDTATGRWYMGEFLDLPGGARSMNSICYYDTYRRIDGQWYIQTRKFEALYHGPADLSGEFFKLPA